MVCIIRPQLSQAASIFVAQETLGIMCNELHALCEMVMLAMCTLKAPQSMTDCTNSCSELQLHHLMALACGILEPTLTDFRCNDSIQDICHRMFMLHALLCHERAEIASLHQNVQSSEHLQSFRKASMLLRVQRGRSEHVAGLQRCCAKAEND